MSFRALFLLVAFLLIAPSVASAQTPLPSCYMSVAPATINKGGSVTLKWTSQNATSANIPGPGLGAVSTVDQRNLIPISSTRWVGTFTGPGGKTTCSATVLVLNEGSPMVVTDAETSVGTVSPSGSVGAPGGVGGAGTISNPGTIAAPAPLPIPAAPNAAPILPTAAPVQVSQSEGTGIVPCTGLNCQACDLAKLGQNIVNFLIGLSIPLAAAMFAWAGVLYFSSSVVNKLEKAKKIFTSVLIGFSLAVGSWLIVQTFLSTVLKDSYKNWNSIQCVSAQSRPMNKTVQDLLGSINILNNLNTSTDGRLTGPLASDRPGAVISNVTCYEGSTYDPTIGTCLACTGEGASRVCEETYPKAMNTPTVVGRGDCSPETMQAIWGGNANAMSCIAQGESSCNPNLGSRVDQTADQQAFSYGLYQVNMTVHNVSCTNFNGGATVNCPQAFSGRNYGARVINSDLYNQCREMLQNADCNTQMAQRIFQQQGFNAWRNTARNCGI